MLVNFVSNMANLELKVRIELNLKDFSFWFRRLHCCSDAWIASTLFAADRWRQLGQKKTYFCWIRTFSLIYALSFKKFRNIWGHVITFVTEWEGQNIIVKGDLQTSFFNWTKILNVWFETKKIVLLILQNNLLIVSKFTQDKEVICVNNCPNFCSVCGTI